MKRKEKKIDKVIKRVKIRNLVFLVLLLVANTYAWFIYATQVNTDVTVHVSSWNVEFFVNEHESVTNMIIDIARAYPGMETYEKKITVYNDGETQANLRYELRAIKIMNTTYRAGDTMTPAELETKLRTDYPFQLSVDVLTSGFEEANQPNVIGQYVVRFSWPFESGDDAKDTEWGNNSYEFNKLYPNQNFISLSVDLIASQRN